MEYEGDDLPHEFRVKGQADRRAEDGCQR